MDAEEMGQAVMEFIIDHGLVSVDKEVIKPEYDGGLMVWNINAAEQIGQFVKELKGVTP